MPHSFKYAAVAKQNATQLQTYSCCHAECHTASPSSCCHAGGIIQSCLGHLPLSVTMHCHAIMQHRYAVITVVQSQHGTCNIHSIIMGILPCGCRAGTPCNLPHKFPLELLPVACSDKQAQFGCILLGIS